MNRKLFPSVNAIAFFIVAVASLYVTSSAQASEVRSWSEQQPSSQSVEVLEDRYVQDRELSLEQKELVNNESTQNLIASILKNSDAVVIPANLQSYPTAMVTATGYTAGVESTGKSPGDELYGTTFSGVQVVRDTYSTIAADPDVFPIGSILYIPGYGFGVVADTGSAINGNIIDLYYDTVDEVFSEWGKKQLEIIVVKEGNGTFTEEELTELNKG